MRVLAFETSMRQAEVALCENDQMVASQTLPKEKSTAAFLVPMIRDLLEQQSWSKRELDLIAVSIGPGSFTGLRVGLTIAKTWSFACEIPILGIGTFEVLVAQATPGPLICPMIPAQRGQVFASLYKTSEAEGIVAVAPPRWTNPENWLATVPQDTVLVGEGISLLEQSVPDGFVVSPESTWRPQAKTVASLAWSRFNAGEKHSPLELKPLYLRPSAAEEKRLAGSSDTNASQS